ncbi:ester cyclase [Dinghuibacter silviterrae]|uniref:SnoaL-like polyketide cyclase n=1 Tax=Dinghuibacter silviterrae TaxID=1539049 RepID=A0A4R8DSB2_9BACT|nr:ester cyclase [Dinghuibacter silviterrae]TDX00305.1 SnoaL-like polyketide cyclase [Dinghuibacter silviterrae]
MTYPIVSRFIQQAWNRGGIPELHPSFVDHSLPPGVATTRDWIALTSLSFEHQTIIEDHVAEGDKCVVRITFRVRHIGEWRGIPATFLEAETRGYRMFRVQDGKIIEHWALLDGQALENQLRGAASGCAAPRG